MKTKPKGKFGAVDFFAPLVIFGILYWKFKDELLSWWTKVYRPEPVQIVLKEIPPWTLVGGGIAMLAAILFLFYFSKRPSALPIIIRTAAFLGLLADLFLVNTHWGGLQAQPCLPNIPEGFRVAVDKFFWFICTALPLFGIALCAWSIFEVLFGTLFGADRDPLRAFCGAGLMFLNMLAYAQMFFLALAIKNWMDLGTICFLAILAAGVEGMTFANDIQPEKPTVGYYLGLLLGTILGSGITLLVGWLSWSLFIAAWSLSFV